MGYAHNVGRIGALALALGVGLGLGTTPGVALADDTGGTADSSSGGSSPSAADTSKRAPATDTKDATDADSDDSADSAPAVDDEDTDTVDAVAESQEPPLSDDDHDGPRRKRAGLSTEAELQHNDDAPVDTPEPEAPVQNPAPAEAAPAPPEVSAPPAEPAGTPADQAPLVTPIAASTAVALPSVLAPLLGATGGPAQLPVESPALWVLLAAARRQIGQTDPATLTTPTGGAVTTALLTPEQAAVITRVGDIVAGEKPTDVVATDTRAYVANSGSNSISVLDTLNGTLLQTISLRSAPTRLAITPDGDRVYATSAEAGTVSVIDTATFSVIRTIDVGDTPTGIAVNPSGSRVYVVNSGDGTVSKISTATNWIVGTVYGVGTGVSSIAISADGARIYTTSNATGDVSYFSPYSLSAGTIADVTPGSLGVAFNADGSRVFVADPTGSIRIIDTTSRQVVDSIPVAVGVPFDVAVSADGTTLFVARSDDGKLSVYDIATKAELTTIVANPYLIGGPPAVALSPDGAQLYWTDFSSDRIHVISLIAPNVDPTAAAPVVNAPNASGVVTGSVVVLDPDGDPLTHTVSTPGKGSVTVTQSNGVFSFTYTPTAAARHAAAATNAPDGAKRDSFTLTVSDGYRGVVTVPVTVVIAPANTAPTATARAVSSWFSANVIVTVTGKDADKDALTYTASSAAKGGTVVTNGKGTFTYTPTAAARHAAANSNATEADKQDTFVVTVDDGHGGVTPLTVTVKIKPGNAAPTATARATSSWFSDRVFVTITSKDTDKDALTYTASATALGGTVVAGSRGRFTYTPTPAARHAAAADDATEDATRDTFDVSVDDGHGGITTVAVTVTVKPVNSAPTRASVADVFTNPNSGLVTGRITTTDADDDELRYATASVTKKGQVTIGSDGTFAYTPTDDARAAASRRFAPSWDRTDSFRVTIDDGHGGIRALTVRVDIAPLGHQNQAPANGNSVASQPQWASGKVTGVVTAVDPERDPLTYTGSGLTSKGSVLVSALGTFVYTPSDAARHQANADDATPADKVDEFTVTVLDGNGGALAVPVTVDIGPSLNRPPTNGSFTAAANLITGVVIGGATATDPNNDPLTFTGSTTTIKGSVVVDTDGGFEYTPTEAARLAAAAIDASLADRQDNFTVFVKDGHGGTLAIPVTVPVVGASAGLGL
ncbi:MAG: Ig-like domain-containing protein [Mycobacterium sp.]